MPFSSFPSSLLSFYSSLSLPSCCGAGTAADTEKTTDLLSSNLTIFSLNSGRNPRVIMAVNILQDMLYRFVEHQTCTRIYNNAFFTASSQQQSYIFWKETTASTFKICLSDLMLHYTLKRYVLSSRLRYYNMIWQSLISQLIHRGSWSVVILSQCFILFNEQMKGMRRLEDKVVGGGLVCSSVCFCNFALYQ